jgi:hypothetical protein
MNMKNILLKGIVVVWLGVVIITAAPSICISSIMTFGTGPETNPAVALPYQRTYIENGMVVTSYSHFSAIGDPLFGNPIQYGNALYFHGTNEYVEFRMADGSKFDLNSFDLMTNLYLGRYIQTSKGYSQELPGVLFQTLTFSGDHYSDLDWFRIVTPWFATQVDNINFTSRQTGSSVPLPPSVLFLGSGIMALIFALRKGTL